MGDGRARELLPWCLPALVLGAIARGYILYHYPYGIVHPDSEDFLITASDLLRHHRFVLHAKKAFLVPILFALPVLFRIPCLVVVPWAQHICGLIFTVMIGALVRMWMRLWKVWIVPMTIMATLNPTMLWYEHTLIAEFAYLWCATALALAGTVCALRPGKWTFAALLGALILTAGSRPEGKLYGMFCLLLVSQIDWGGWKARAMYCGVALAVSAMGWFSCRDSEGGLLLYATVLPLAPDAPRSAPEFGPMIKPLRDKCIASGEGYLTDLVGEIVEITPIAVRYLESAHKNRNSYAEFCQRLAIEAALRQPLRLPKLALDKFLLGFNYAPCGDFGTHWLRDMQMRSCTYKDWMPPLAARLAGPRLALPADVAAAMKMRNPAKMNAVAAGHLKLAIGEFIREEYVPLGRTNLFSILQRMWSWMTLMARIGKKSYAGVGVPDIPLFFIGGMAGMLASARRPGPLRKLHVAWVVTLGCVGMLVMLTGVVNARYRFVFEPFFLLYNFALLDFLAALFIRRSSVAQPCLDHE